MKYINVNWLKKVKVEDDGSVFYFILFEHSTSCKLFRGRCLGIVVQRVRGTSSTAIPLHTRMTGQVGLAQGGADEMSVHMRGWTCRKNTYMCVCAQGVKVIRER